MARGLPFLDIALLEFASCLRPSLRVRGMSLKRVLKQAVSDLLPRELLSRRERGFGVPLGRWLREDLSAFTRSTLGDGARVRQHLVGAELNRLLAEHDSCARNHGHALWTLITMEMLLRRRDW